MLIFERAAEPTAIVPDVKEDLIKKFNLTSIADSVARKLPDDIKNPIRKSYKGYVDRLLPEHGNLKKIPNLQAYLKDAAKVEEQAQGDAKEQGQGDAKDAPKPESVFAKIMDMNYVPPKVDTAKLEDLINQVWPVRQPESEH